jgi:hypothetical protein
MRRADLIPRRGAIAYLFGASLCMVGLGPSGCAERVLLRPHLNPTAVGRSGDLRVTLRWLRDMNRLQYAITNLGSRITIRNEGPVAPVVDVQGTVLRLRDTAVAPNGGTLIDRLPFTVLDQGESFYNSVPLDHIKSRAPRRGFTDTFGREEHGTSTSRVRIDRVRVEVEIYPPWPRRSEGSPSLEPGPPGYPKIASGELALGRVIDADLTQYPQ